MSREWAKAGLSLNRTKTKAWAPKADTVLSAGWGEHRTPSLGCLGADLVEDVDEPVVDDIDTNKTADADAEEAE